MSRYCKICRNTFLSDYELTQHVEAKHCSLKIQQTLQTLERPQQFPRNPLKLDADLWRKPIMRPPPNMVPTEKSSIPNPLPNIALDLDPYFESELREEDIEESLNNAEDAPHYNYNFQSRKLEIKVAVEDCDVVSDASNDELYLIRAEDPMFDSEDFEGATLDDAVKALQRNSKFESLVKWPNDAYCDFMKLIIEGNISNNFGDKIIKFFKNHSHLETSPLPSSTKVGKDFLGHIKSPSVNFKQKIVGVYSGINIILHYRPVFHTIQTLLQRPNIMDDFALRGTLRIEKVC